MKNILISAVLMSLFGCTTQQAVQSAPQVYRAKNSDTHYTITGKADAKVTEGFFGDTIIADVTIYFDGEKVINGKLDNALTGEFKGVDYKGHTTAASCTSKPLSDTTFEVRCLVFVDNERSVTLTF